MKKLFILTFIASVLFSMFEVLAQVPSGSRQMFGNEFLNRRNTFIISEINLSVDEVNKFIPLENEFKQKMLEVGQECRSLARESQNRRNMTDAEYMKLVDCNIETRIKESQLEKEYFEKFKKILSPEKLYKYLEADAKFTRELINNMRNALPDRNNLNRPTDRNNPNRPIDRNNTNRPANNNNPIRPGNTR